MLDHFNSNKHLMSGSDFDVDVLLPKPKGIMVTIKCNHCTTLAEIKDKVWQKVINISELGAKSKFCFEGISQMAMLERYDDDTTSLGDTKLFSPLLKLVENRVVDVNKQYIANLSMLVGRNVIMDGMKINSTEVTEYQELMDQTSLNFNEIRLKKGFRAYLTQKHPLSTTNGIHGVVATHEEEFNTMQYNIWIDSTFRTAPVHAGKMNKITSFCAPFRATVATIISTLVECEKLALPYEYLIKVSGREEFFFEDQRILPSYTYIQKCIRDNVIPELVLTSYSEFIIPPGISETITDENVEASLGNMFTISPLHYCVTSGHKVVCSLKEKFTICISSLSGLNPDRGYQMRIFVGLYCGSSRLEQRSTTERPMTSVVEWNENIAFDIDTADLPRAAKICISIQKRKNKSAEYFKTISLYWINIAVFNYKGFLRQGKFERHVWPESLLGGFHEKGPLSPYHLTDTPVLTVNFKERKTPIRYYTLMEAKDLAINSAIEDNLKEAEARELEEDDNKQLMTLLRHLYGTYILTDSNKELLWYYRVHCCQHFPESLPKLLGCVNWEQLAHSCQMYTLLLDWKEISVATALQLLHLDIADPHIREFAVHSLDLQLTDEQLQLYLLQLVEVLKHDMYIDSALSRFLLKRALNNHVLGHYLYWHLRSQVDSQQFGLRFGLVLEFYLRCCGPHLSELNTMSHAMSKITMTYKRCTQQKHKDFKDYKDEIRQLLLSTGINKAMSGFVCIFDPRLRTRDVIVDKAMVFNSKMKPMKIDFTNHDITAAPNNFSMIYKMGDDLRQDQLVSQFIMLMDRIWLEEDIDLKLIAYNIICTSYEVGIIEFIAKSQPLSSLIINYRTFSALKIWLREKNPQQLDFEEAKFNFMQSCCGYTLIHYVLGISDRHPSNILLREDGRIIHIDFGHILGHRKAKLGINREPAPFIFMKEFVDFISNDKGASSPEFRKFEQQFTKAFLVLRKHTEEFLTLLHLMVTAGLKELNTPLHVDYFSQAMCVGKTDDEAERRILKLLHDSIRLTPAVQAHWFAHIINKM